MLWLYHFSERPKVAQRCPQDNDWISDTKVLFGAGLIFNAQGATSQPAKFGHYRSCIEQHKQLLTHLTCTYLYMYIPDKIPIVGNHEVQLLEEMSPPEVVLLDGVNSQVMMPPQTFDIDSLLHMHQTSLRRERQTYWHLIITTVFCANTILGILCFSLRSCLHNDFTLLF